MILRSYLAAETKQINFQTDNVIGQLVQEVASDQTLNESNFEEQSGELVDLLNL